MRKHLALSVIFGWLIALTILYFLRDFIAITAFAQNGIPDEAFRWIENVGRTIFWTVIGFSLMFALSAGLLWQVSRFFWVPALALCLAACSGSPEKLVHPVRTLSEIETRHGKLILQWAEEVFTLKRDEYTIFQDMSVFHDAHSVVAQGKLGKADYLVLGRYASDGCPETNILVTLLPDSSYQVYHLGNCEEPKILNDGEALTFRYPETRFESVHRRAEAWRYHGGKLVRLR